jgi:ATP-dependent helicase/nuclease subunit A
LRRSLVDDACRIIGDPLYAELFSPAALAEAPIAAVVGAGIVISGTVDRLLVTDERILVADFKTGRRAPADASEIPAAHLRQMAAYSSALRVIFPGRKVEAALLYTSGPHFHLLPEALLQGYEAAG